MMLMTFYISRIALDLLGEEVYGLVSIVTGVVILSAFFTTVLESAAQRFISQSLALNNDIKSTISTFIGLNIIIAIIITLIVYIAGSYYIENNLIQSVVDVNVVHTVLIYALMTFLINMLCSPIMAVFIAHEKLGVYSLFSFVEVMIKLVLLKFIIIDFNQSVIYYSQVLFTSVIVSRLIAIIIAKLMFNQLSIIPVLDKKKVKTIVSYISWNVFGTLAAVANNQGMSILINVFFSLSISASRAIANQLNSAIIQVVNSVQIAINPQIFKSYVKNDFDYLNMLIDINGRVVVYLTTVVVITCFGNVHKLLELWLGEYPDYLIDFILLMLVDVYIVAQTSALVSVVQASGNIRLYQLVVGGTMLVNIPLCYLILDTEKEPLVIYIVPLVISLICMFQRLLFVLRLRAVSIERYIKSVIIRGLAILLLLIFIKNSYVNYYPNNSLYIDISFSVVVTTLMWLLFGLKHYELKHAIVFFEKIKTKFYKDK
ncbi:hypothetical protein [Vibrio furnissii]|uniref:hypothetical protein n=1 Tax=Vibrio furnissii TaxID=29494 RepID=UPI0013023B25|nr:hypothetical protein [Vibrio furnissii]